MRRRQRRHGDGDERRLRNKTFTTCRANNNRRTTKMPSNFMCVRKHGRFVPGSALALYICVCVYLYMPRCDRNASRASRFILYIYACVCYYFLLNRAHAPGIKYLNASAPRPEINFIGCYVWLVGFWNGGAARQPVLRTHTQTCTDVFIYIL